MAEMPASQFSILAGASGCGKTTLILQAWAEHEKKPGCFPISFDPSIQTAGIILADRTSAEAAARIKALGIQRMQYVGLVDDRGIGRALIKQPDKLWDHLIKKLDPKHGLVIVDPLGLFMEGSLIDYKSVAASLIQFSRFANDFGVTLMGLHHTTKARTDQGFKRPQDRISGSGAFPGYSSTQCMMIEGLEDKEPYDTLVIVPHMTPKEEYKLVRKLDGYFTVVEQMVKDSMSDFFSVLKEPVMKIPDFTNLAAQIGMTDEQIKDWIENDPRLHVEGGYIIMEGKDGTTKK